MHKSFNKYLAGGACILAILAFIAGNPVRGHRVSVDLNELSSQIEKEEDHWTTGELADWIMQNKSGLRIIDLRDSSDYARYHIPGAEQISFSKLFTNPLDRNGTIILYSEGGTHASQAWILMRADGYKNVFTLKGGLQAWEDEILHPHITVNASPEEQRLYPFVIERARFFGGDSLLIDSVSHTTASAKDVKRTVKKSPPPPNVSKETERIKEGC